MFGDFKSCTVLVPLWYELHKNVLFAPIFVDRSSYGDPEPKHD